MSDCKKDIDLLLKPSISTPFLGGAEEQDILEHVLQISEINVGLSYEWGKR